MVSIKLKSTDLQGIVLPTFFQAATIDNTGLAYKLIRNTTLVGAAFTDHPDPNSFTQYDVSATSFAGGIILDSGFVTGGGGGTGIEINPRAAVQIGRVGIGTTIASDTLTLVVAYMANSNNAKNAVASMTWIEQR
jgi:hypothetical protein